MASSNTGIDWDAAIEQLIEEEIAELEWTWAHEPWANEPTDSSGQVSDPPAAHARPLSPIPEEQRSAGPSSSRRAQACGSFSRGRTTAFHSHWEDLFEIGGGFEAKYQALLKWPSGGTSVDEHHLPCARYICTALPPCVEQSPQEMQEISNTDTVKGVFQERKYEESGNYELSIILMVESTTPIRKPNPPIQFHPLRTRLSHQETGWGLPKNLEDKTDSAGREG
ncbi:hypothetical protein DM02DRAFT_658322 [Periconia macrospinosa]|uniref:Uncharacterized protein n=1 Tax=Periconia macrospinosa TaxID=97972 RepID=A0A2V1DJS7_9PLEO|nr:hypothetical protein DM02DRAFT_658322 [Periconia macrospinosa]